MFRALNLFLPHIRPRRFRNRGSMLRFEGGERYRGLIGVRLCRVPSHWLVSILPLCLTQLSFYSVPFLRASPTLSSPLHDCIVCDLPRVGLVSRRCFTDGVGVRGAGWRVGEQGGDVRGEFLQCEPGVTN